MEREYIICNSPNMAVVASLDDVKGSKLELFIEKQTIVREGKILEKWVRSDGKDYGPHFLPMLRNSFHKIYELGKEYYRELMETGKLPFDENDIIRYECGGCEELNQGSPVLQLVIVNPLLNFLTQVELDYFCKACDTLVFGHALRIKEAKRLVEERGISSIRFDGSGDFIVPTQGMIDEQLKMAYKEAKDDGSDGGSLFSPALKQAEQWAAKIGYDITDEHTKIVDSYNVERRKLRREEPSKNN